MGKWFSKLMRTRRSSRRVGYVGTIISVLVIVGGLIRENVVPGTGSFTELCVAFGVLGIALSGGGAGMLAGSAEDEAEAERDAGISPRLFIVAGTGLSIVMMLVLIGVVVFG